MDTRIVNIGQIVTPLPTRSTPSASLSLSVREHTDLLIHDGRIADVATSAKVSIDAEIDAGGGVVMPGLIDPHTHHPGSSKPDGDADTASVARRLHRALKSGVTTVEVKCANLAELADLAAVIRAEAAPLPHVVATLYAEPPPQETPHAERMATLIGDAIPTARRGRLASFCDVACGNGAYSPDEARTILRAARASGLHLKLHTSSDDVGTVGAVAVDLGVSAVGHVANLEARETAAWKRVGVLPVILPGDALLEGGHASSASHFLAADLAFGIGTNVGGGESTVGSMWLVLALAVGSMGLMLDQALTAATAYNAQVLESGDEIGTLDVGKRADLLILDVADYRDLLGGLGEEPIRAVVRDGRLVHER
jgi:imidazolonepropionase